MKKQSHAWAVTVNGNIVVAENFMGVNTLSLFRTKKEAKEFKLNMSPCKKSEHTEIIKVSIRTDSA